jgi:hypothetical protein
MKERHFAEVLDQNQYEHEHYFIAQYTTMIGSQDGLLSYRYHGDLFHSLHLRAMA